MSRLTLQHFSNVHFRKFKQTLNGPQSTYLFCFVSTGSKKDRRGTTCSPHLVSHEKTNFDQTLLAEGEAFHKHYKNSLFSVFLAVSGKKSCRKSNSNTIRITKLNSNFVRARAKGQLDHTAQKMKFPFTKEIFNGRPRFLCCVIWLLTDLTFSWPLLLKRSIEMVSVNQKSAYWIYAIISLQRKEINLYKSIINSQNPFS